jgi:hypothetical protein
VRGLCVALALTAACSAPTHAPPGDAGSDAGATPLLCNPTFGTTYILSAYGLTPPDDGFDLNGDGKPDNVMGNMASFVNPLWQSQLARGYALYLLDFLTPISTTTDVPHLDMNFYVGIDADMPPDPSNNLGGMGRFLVPLQQFDVNCQPTTPWTMQVQSGVLTGTAPRMDIVVQAIGTISSTNAVLRDELKADGSGFTGKAGAVASACGLSQIAAPVGSNTLLDVMVNVFELQPDIDQNHDGMITHLVGDGTKVTACVTPDGTSVPGIACACDPRVADGFSLCFSHEAVPATIVGIVGTP